MSKNPCNSVKDWQFEFSQCLYDWQGLEAGGLAIIAAGIGGYFLNKQIEQSDKHQREALARKHRAIRATLPLTLSGLCDWTEGMLLELDRAKTSVRNSHAAKFSGTFSPPDLPVELITQLQATIETTSERTIVVPLSHVIREVQVLWARTSELNNQRQMSIRIGIEDSIIENLIQTAQIRILVDELFDYARSETELGPSSATWQRVDDHLIRTLPRDKALRKAVAGHLQSSVNFWELPNDR